MIYNGTNKANVFTGTAGNDVVQAKGGNDTIKTGAGSDYINAGAGDDLIVGGAGHDYLIGGLGKDVFLFAANDSTSGDHILDFSAGDKIGFTGVSQKTVWQEFEADGDLLVHYGSLGGTTNTITFENVHHTLAYSDFMFG